MVARSKIPTSGRTLHLLMCHRSTSMKGLSLSALAVSHRNRLLAECSHADAAHYIGPATPTQNRYDLARQLVPTARASAEFAPPYSSCDTPVMGLKIDRSSGEIRPLLSKVKCHSDGDPVSSSIPAAAIVLVVSSSGILFRS